MKQKRKKLLGMLLLTMTVIFTGCAKEEEKPVDIKTDLKDAVYKPDNYQLKLPDETWVIKGKENPEKIVFQKEENQIHVTHTSEEKQMEAVESIPKSEEELKEQLAGKLNSKDVSILFFNSSANYKEQKFLGQVEYTYKIGSSGQYITYLALYTDKELYELRGTTDNDENLISQMNTLFQEFQFKQDGETRKLDTEKQISVKGNTYTSKNGDFSIKLPYEEWAFEINENTTNIISDKINVSVTEVRKQEQNNSIEYEVPRDLTILQKQIELKNLGQYELKYFNEKTIGTVMDREQESNFVSFQYRLKLNEKPDGNVYYMYSEYRGENSTYQITAKSKIDTPEAEIQLNEIVSSFLIN